MNAVETLNRPPRTKEQAALDIAIASLREIVRAPATKSLLSLTNEAKTTASAALDRIDTLLSRAA